MRQAGLPYVTDLEFLRTFRSYRAPTFLPAKSARALLPLRIRWPRERRWPLLLITRCYGRARCAGRSCLIKECYGRARGAGRSNGSLTLLVACEQVICRQISWWRRSVLARADTRIRPLSSSPTLVAVIVLTVPRAQKKKTNALQAGPPR